MSCCQLPSHADGGAEETSFPVLLPRCASVVEKELNVVAVLFYLWQPKLFNCLRRMN